MTPSKSATIWGILSGPPIRPAMYSRSTRAFSPMDTARASTAVSTLVTARRFWMVRLVNISALRSRLPSSSSTSSEHSRG